MFSIEFNQDTYLDELRKIRLILDTLIGDEEDEWPGGEDELLRQIDRLRAWLSSRLEMPDWAAALKMSFPER